MGNWLCPAAEVCADEPLSPSSPYPPPPPEPTGNLLWGLEGLFDEHIPFHMLHSWDDFYRLPSELSGSTTDGCVVIHWPAFEAEKTEVIVEEEEEEKQLSLSCTICQDEMEKGARVKALDCSHVFHSACINPWLALNTTCPVCRHPVTTHQHDHYYRTRNYC